MINKNKVNKYLQKENQLSIVQEKQCQISGKLFLQLIKNNKDLNSNKIQWKNKENIVILFKIDKVINCNNFIIYLLCFITFYLIIYNLYKFSYNIIIINKQIKINDNICIQST